MILAAVLLMKADVKQAERKLCIRRLYSFVTLAEESIQWQLR
jgi:hypothetical protein